MGSGNCDVRYVVSCSADSLSLNCVWWGLEAADNCSHDSEESDPNAQRRFRDKAAFLPSLTSPRVKVAAKPQLQLPTPFWPLRVTPHVAESAAHWLGDGSQRRGARSRRGGYEGEAKETTIPAFLAPATAYRERKRRELGFGPQLPAPPAMSPLSFQNAEKKRDWENGGLLESVLRKAGKANYTSRLAARGCACALMPVAILPLLRHRKQTQFLVFPSLGGGAF